MTRGAHRYHPYKRQSKRPHFSFSSETHMSNVIMDDGSGPNKRQRGEARMIPGVDGIKTFGFPNSIITKLRYVDYMTLSSTSGSVAKNVFSANGIFDPDITNAGHQPMYFDEYKAIYNNYVVLGSKITVHFNNYSTQAGWHVGIIGDDDATTSTSASTLMEYNNSIWTVMGQRDSGNNIKTLTATYEPLEALGVDAKDDGWSAINTGANPDQKWYYSVWCNTIDASSASVTITAEIEYTVKFTELRSPTAS